MHMHSNPLPMTSQVDLTLCPACVPVLCAVDHLYNKVASTPAYVLGDTTLPASDSIYLVDMAALSNWVKLYRTGVTDLHYGVKFCCPSQKYISSASHEWRLMNESEVHLQPILDRPCSSPA